MSPHMTIYEPQLTSLMSIGFRMTGAGLAVLVYGAGLAAAASPELLVATAEAVASLPESVQTAGKLVVAGPFVYHAFNGMRHLAWDAGCGLSLKGVYRGGYIVMGATAIGTLLLMLSR